MKVLKYTLFALGGLIVLAVVVLAVVAATFDPNQYKPQIVQAVKEKTQRTLRLDGNIGLAFWPSIGARVGKASLSEHASDREFAAVEEVRVSLKLLPLLSKQAVVDTVRIKGLRANIVKTKDGKLNVDDLAGAPDAKEKPASKGPEPGVQVDVAGVEITDATVTYTDQVGGAKYALSKVNLKTGRIAPGVSIRFDAEVDQIDLDGSQQPAGKPAPAQKPAGKEEPFDLSGLRKLRAAGTLKIGSLKANGVKASNVRLDIKANDGRVDVNPLLADFYQGKLKSAIAIDAVPATPTFAVKHNMSGISIGQLLKDLADADLLEGKGDVAVDVTTQGNTVSALKKALDGNASLKMADGALKGIDIAGSIRNAKARLGALRGEHDQAADKAQKTDFSELTATFKIAKGVARNNDLSLKSPLLRVGGEGEINIAEDRLNYLVKASIVGTSKGQGGRDTEELSGITVPVRVAGPLEKPSYKLDFGKVATESAKQRLGDELQKRLGGGASKDPAAPEEKKSGSSTRDQLRDLIRR